jgi:hypothetical protein
MQIRHGDGGGNGEPDQGSHRGGSLNCPR